MLVAKSRSWFARRVLAAALIVTADAALAQGSGDPRYPITENDIAKALNSVGLHVDTSQVLLPIQMNSAIAEPKLEIAKAKSLGDRQIRLELRCHVTSECLPFLVTVNVNDSDSFLVESRSKIGLANAAGHPTATKAATVPASTPQLKVGSRAVMEMRDGHLDIHLQVLAIDAGSIGQQVRVCTLDRKKIFHATVTAEGTVTGAIQ
jgi:hypothetical protein